MKTINNSRNMILLLLLCIVWLGAYAQDKEPIKPQQVRSEITNQPVAQQHLDDVALPKCKQTTNQAGEGSKGTYYLAPGDCTPWIATSQVITLTFTGVALGLVWHDTFDPVEDDLTFAYQNVEYTYPYFSCDYRICAESNADPGTYDVDAIFIFVLGSTPVAYYTEYQKIIVEDDECSMLVTNPGSGSEWLIGATMPIQWNSDNCSGTVSIKLYKGATNTLTISSSTADDGYFAWIIPGTIVPGTNYNIKITCSADPQCYDYSGYFEIKEPYFASPSNLSATVLENDISLSWSDPFSNSAFNEDFEGTVPPGGWLKLSPDGGTGWESLSVGTTPLPGWTGGVASACPSGGSRQAYCTWTTGGASMNDQWIITPQITVSASAVLEFYMIYYMSSYTDHIEILLSTSSQNQPAAFNVVLDEIDFTAASSTQWQLYSYELTDFVSVGAVVYIAFRETVADNYNNGSAISIDNVYVGAPLSHAIFDVVKQNTLYGYEVPPNKDFAYVHDPFTQFDAGRGFLGYNVYRNSIKINTSILTTTEFFDTDLFGGTYSYFVTAVYSDGESDPSNTVVVEVLGAPALCLSATEIDLGAHPQDYTFSQSFLITNCGDGLLEGTITESSDWITNISLTTFQLAAAEELLVYFSGAFENQSGSISAEIAIESNGGNQVILVTGYAQIPTLTPDATVCEDHITYFPNPVKDMLHITIPNAQSITLQLSNLLGEPILATTFPCNKGVLDTTGLPSGLYLLQITTDSGTFLRKIIKD